MDDDAADQPVPRAWGVVAVAGGSVLLAAGVGLAPHLGGGALVAASLAVLAVVAGLALLVWGTRHLLRHTGRVAKVAGILGAVAVALVAVSIVAPAVYATNVPATEVGARPESVGLDAESVTIRTFDGVDLAAWYVPSTNGAAVVLLHGAGSTRSDVLDEADVLAGHGYGVLLLDARGHGDSDGEAMDFGWWGDRDVAAATDFLARRPDVDPGRIGLVGLSMGGEEAVGAAGSDPDVRAVVAEGATARTAEDKSWLSDEYGLRGAVQERLEALQYLVTAVLADAPRPSPLRSAVAASGDTRFLLVTAGDVPDEARAAAHLAGGAPDRVEVWTVPGAGHVGGLATAPEEWAARVLGFLDANLD